jgi:hypothetical protein
VKDKVQLLEDFSQQASGHSGGLRPQEEPKCQQYVIPI